MEKKLKKTYNKSFETNKKYAPQLKCYSAKAT